jgi:hypothetical protein
MGVYSICFHEDNVSIEQPFDYEDGMWHMHFDGAQVKTMEHTLYYTLMLVKFTIFPTY